MSKVYSHEEVREIIEGCNLVILEYFKLLSKSLENKKKGNPMFPNLLDYNYPLTGNSLYKEFLNYEMNLEAQEIKRNSKTTLIQLPSIIDYGIIIKELSDNKILELNLKYNHVKWAPKVTIEFRAGFLKIAEKEAEELGFNFTGDYDYEIIDDSIYYYPMYKSDSEESIKGKYLKVTDL